jgi:hypothetical protein
MPLCKLLSSSGVKGTATLSRSQTWRVAQFRVNSTFCRIFSDAAGISPGRFLAAAHAPGKAAAPEHVDVAQGGELELPCHQSATAPASAGRTISQMVSLPSGHARAGLYVGVFDSPIVEGRPAAASAFSIAAPHRSRRFAVTGVP